MNNAVKTCAAVAAFALLHSAAFAQTPNQPSVPQKQGIFSKLFHPKPKPGIYQSNGSMAHPMGGHSMMNGHSMMGGSMLGGHSMMGGQIVGNKNSHVYHMPGDKGSLPSAQNRVYFSSAAAAEAAGYHAAGGGRGMTSHSPMTRGSMTHGAQVYH